MKPRVCSVLDKIRAVGRLRRRGFDNPFGRDIAAADATRLGVNIILYAMTH
jgi:hypothetical protein